MKKIIIIYSTAGLGHEKAAMALLRAFRDRVKGSVEVKAIDLLEYASGFYRFLYTTFYLSLVNHAKCLWAGLYYFPNHPAVDAMTRNLRESLDLRNLKMLKPKLAEESPDAIVATHFLLPGIATGLKQVEGFRSRIYAAMTDYGPHSYWLSPHVDRYFVGSPSASVEMVKRGIPPEKVTVTGIPTLEEFSGEFDRREVRRTHGLDAKKKTVFLFSGGFGVGPVEKMLLSLNACRADIQVITVCGRNEALYEKLGLLRERLDYPLLAFGYTEKIAELMGVSDLMITKAGGISVTEALNARLPMILFASIPGQETWNECFLLDNGAAVKAEKLKDIPVEVDRVLMSRDIDDSLKAAIEKIRRPHAAEEVVDVVLGDIGV